MAKKKKPMGKKKKKSILAPRKMIDIGAELYLDMMIEGRMLIQASSGGGKSYMLRVLAEHLLPHLPVIILDWEGEFASLREEHDMVLIGSEGETPCRVRTAGLVARGLVEAHMSAIIDLSDLNPQERKEYVRDFLVAMIDGLPKKHWPINNERDIVVMVDEAHRLCPQSKKCVSTEAVVNLICQGRKRGIGGILATQRLSKLDKDAAAECKTSLIGSCALIDAKTGCDILGLPKTSQHDLTQLPTGFWKGIGLAFTMRGVQEFTGSLADTSHGRDRRQIFLPARRTKKLGKLFEKLSQIQDKAEQDINDVAEANKKIGVLKREVKRLEKAKPGADTKEVAAAIEEALGLASVQHEANVENAVARGMELSAKQRDGVWKPLLAQANKEIEKLLADIESIIHAGQKALPARKRTVDAPDMPKRIVYASKRPASSKPLPSQPAPATGMLQQRQRASAPVRKPVAVSSSGGVDDLVAANNNGTLSRPEQQIVDSIAWWNNVGVNQPEKSCVAVIAGRKIRSSGVRNLFSQLSKGGYVEYPAPGCVCLTDDGARTANKPSTLGSIDELHGALRAVMNGPQREIFDVVVGVYPESITTEDLADRIGRQASSSGMRNLYSSLRKLGVIESKAPIRATKLVFPAELV